MNQAEYNELLKSKLIEVFGYTIDFLNSHNLRWYVCAGTAIGTVRHKNIIPWDDDIDILMPREDYDRFLEVSGEMSSSHYKLFSLRDKGYCYPYYKVVDMTTTMWEKELIPCILGAYVDVFPLEDSNVTPQEFKTYYDDSMSVLLKYRRSLSIPTWRSFVKLLTHFRLLTVKDVIINYLYYRWRSAHFIKKYIELENKFYTRGGKYFAQPYGFAGPEKDIYKKEWFSEVIQSPFANLTVNLPIGYDNYLTQIYGDYMTPPPESERQITHSRVYINLKERLTIPEIEKRVKQGITREA